MAARKPEDSFCVKCGRPYPIDYFYKSPNPNHTKGVLPYCKDCCNEMIHKNLKIHFIPTNLFISLVISSFLISLFTFLFFFHFTVY